MSRAVVTVTSAAHVARPVRDAPVAPLLDRLPFTRGVQNWGTRLRFGRLGVSRDDIDRIAAAWPRPERPAAHRS